MMESGMSRENYLLVCGIILIGLGVMFCVLTPVVVAQFLIGVEPSAIVLGLERNIGAALFAFGVVNVMARRSTDAIGLRAIIVGTIGLLGLTAALDVYMIVIGLFAPIGWGVVVFKAVLIGGYVYNLGNIRSGTIF